MQQTVKPFAKGADGHAKLVCAKDRQGNYRAGARVADLIVTHTPELRMELHAPGADTETTGATGTGDWRPTALMERISLLVEGSDMPLSLSAIVKGGRVKGNERHLTRALDKLVGEGYVTVTDGPRGARLHASTRAYRQREDPKSDLYRPSHDDRLRPSPDRLPATVDDRLSVSCLKETETVDGQERRSTVSNSGDGHDGAWIERAIAGQRELFNPQTGETKPVDPTEKGTTT